MINFLELKCPNCGRNDRIEIDARVWVRLAADGAVRLSQNYDYGPDSPAECCACKHSGNLSGFEQGT